MKQQCYVFDKYNYRRPICKYIGELRVQNGFSASLAPDTDQYVL